MRNVREVWLLDADKIAPIAHCLYGHLDLQAQTACRQGFSVEYVRLRSAFQPL